MQNDIVSIEYRRHGKVVTLYFLQKGKDLLALEPTKIAPLRKTIIEKQNVLQSSAR